MAVVHMWQQGTLMRQRPIMHELARKLSIQLLHRIRTLNCKGICDRLRVHVRFVQLHLEQISADLQDRMKGRSGVLSSCVVALTLTQCGPIAFFHIWIITESFLCSIILSKLALIALTAKAVPHCKQLRQHSKVQKHEIT